MIKIGTIAPDFSLLDSSKQLITLSDFRDRKNVLLLFFPFAFSSTCTTQLCSVRDNVSTFRNEHTEVFGISVDSVYSLAAYKSAYNLNYPLLSDFNKVASEKYGVLYDFFSTMKLEGVSKRASFVIDKSGLVQYVEVLENADDIPDFTLIQKSLQFLY